MEPLPCPMIEVPELLGKKVGMVKYEGGDGRSK